MTNSLEITLFINSRKKCCQIYVVHTSGRIHESIFIADSYHTAWFFLPLFHSLVPIFLGFLGCCFFLVFNSFPFVGGRVIFFLWAVLSLVFFVWRVFGFLVFFFRFSGQSFIHRPVTFLFADKTIGVWRSTVVGTLIGSRAPVVFLCRAIRRIVTWFSTGVAWAEFFPLRSFWLRSFVHFA